VTLNANAFSQPRAGGGPFSPAYLYTNNKWGLGVTNPLEGPGGPELSKVDNIDHDGSTIKDYQADYVVFKFSIPVVIDRVLL